jgi:alpha-beta hydrolase superfamily lysophospholipase
MTSEAPGTSARPGHPISERDVLIPVVGAVLAGSLTSPAVARPVGRVLLLGGTFSDLRDGDADPRHRPHIPPHGMYRRLAESLSMAGFGVLRFDRRGCGASTGSRPDRATEIEDALVAWDWLVSNPDLAGPAAMVGESAGAYVLCRMAAAGRMPAAAVLQGALYRSIAGLIDFNASRARAYRDRGPAEAAWLRENAPSEYESAFAGGALVKALEEGRSSVTFDGPEGRVERSLDDLAYDVALPPEDQFRYLACPTLVLHGADDLNVPVEDCFATLQALWRAGNRDVELHVLPGADHSMQATPDDPDERLRERMSFRSFLRPFHDRYPDVVTEYLVRRLA